MIKFKTPKQIEDMRDACRISAIALRDSGKSVQPGVTTLHLNEIATNSIKQYGAKPSFVIDGGFPTACCISVNDEIIHGIPSNKKLKEGDIVSIDVGAYYNDYHGDNAFTFACGKISKDAQYLLDIGNKSLELAIDFLKPDIKTGDLGSFIQKFIESHKLGVVKNFSGHGIGKNIHEDPRIPNYGEEGTGTLLQEGMVIAIEPMLTFGSPEYTALKDGWTIVTKDGSLSAHFENTVAITELGIQVLTVC